MGWQTVPEAVYLLLGRHPVIKGVREGGERKLLNIFDLLGRTGDGMSPNG